MMQGFEPSVFDSTVTTINYSEFSEELEGQGDKHAHR